MQYSFIDFKLKDFVRYDDFDKDNFENVVIIDANSNEEAEDWLLKHADSETDWTNSGTRFWCWDDEE